MTDEAEFIKCVERDAIEFRPMGTKIASYACRDQSPKELKGKRRAAHIVTDYDEDTAVFEIYFVCHLTWTVLIFK